MIVAVLGSGNVISGGIAQSLNSTIHDIDAPVPVEADGVVLVVGTDASPEPTNTNAIGESEWHRLAEQPMRQTLKALQRSRASMCLRGGRIVLIVPTIGLAGAAGLVPYTTATEGIRAMAKSAARQWAADGIAVNMIAAPVHFFAPTLRASGNHLSAPAVDDNDKLIESIVETTRFLLRPDLSHLVGETVIIDGGSVMLP